MTIQLPESLRRYGYVVGRVVEAVADSPADDDRLPEAKPAAGKVTFSPAWTLARTVDADYPAFVVVRDWTMDLSAQGDIVSPDGSVGVWLLAGVWTVRFSLNGGQIANFQIEVTEAHTAASPLQLVSAAPPDVPAHVSLVSIPVPVGGDPGQVLVRSADGGLEWADGGSGGGGVSDHGALTGLTDDDHPIYALADGTRGNFASTSHGHVLAEISDYTAPDLSGLVQNTDPRLSDARTPTAHNHDERYLTGDEVGIALAGKSDTGHTHGQYVENTDARLSDARTPLAHDHSVADVTGLQAELDGKQAAGSYAAASHTHNAADLSGVVKTVNGTAPDGSGNVTVSGGSAFDWAALGFGGADVGADVPMWAIGGHANFTLATGLLAPCAVLNAEQVTVDAVDLYVETGVPGATISFALYTWMGAGKSSTLVASLGTASGAASGRIVSTFTPRLLAPGPHLVLAHSTQTLTLWGRAQSLGVYRSNHSGGGTNSYEFAYATGTPWPSTITWNFASGSTNSSRAAPLLQLRRSA